MPTLDTDFKGKVDFLNNKEIILSVTPKTFITVLSNEIKIYLILSHEIDWSLLDKVDKITFCGVITEKEDPVEKVISPFLVKPRKLRKALLFGSLDIISFSKEKLQICLKGRNFKHFCFEV